MTSKKGRPTNKWERLLIEKEKRSKPKGRVRRKRKEFTKEEEEGHAYFADTGDFYR